MTKFGDTELYREHKEGAEHKTHDINDKENRIGFSRIYIVKNYERARIVRTDIEHIESTFNKSMSYNIQSHRDCKHYDESQNTVQEEHNIKSLSFVRENIERDDDLYAVVYHGLYLHAEKVRAKDVVREDVHAKPAEQREKRKER